MRLGIMQPYFFPYLGYFDLINCTDQWIVFDDVQYIRHGWVNRNRILHPDSGWSFIIVPVNYSRSSHIREVTIVGDKTWKTRIVGQLQHYKKRAPYFREVTELIKDCLSFDSNLISRLNVYTLDKVCTYLNIDFKYSVFSEMGLELESVNEPGDWALRISQAMKANEYVNPPGGEELFSREKFSESNIELVIRRFPTYIYDCPGYEFVPNLSIIDVLMWNSPKKIKDYLDKNR